MSVKSAAVVVLAAPEAACGAADGPVVIRTQAQPLEVCEAARGGRTLVADPTFRLAFENPGYRQGATWPYGYSAHRESGVIVLFDPSGKTIADEGDRILAAGGVATDNAVNVDCDIQVNPGPGA